MIPGSGGVFDVRFGDKLIFSKDEIGRFPEENEVEDSLGELLETE